MAPSEAPAAYCTARGRRPSKLLSQQAASSHRSVAGKAPPVTVAISTSHSAGAGEMNKVATATTASTNITVRSTTPIWQASNSAALARAGPRTRTGAGVAGVADKIVGLRIRAETFGCKPIIASHLGSPP
jgi:hypothetical protein